MPGPHSTVIPHVAVVFPLERIGPGPRCIRETRAPAAAPGPPREFSRVPAPAAQAQAGTVGAGTQVRTRQVTPDIAPCASRMGRGRHRPRRHRTLALCAGNKNHTRSCCCPRTRKHVLLGGGVTHFRSPRGNPGSETPGTRPPSHAERGGAGRKARRGERTAGRQRAWGSRGAPTTGSADALPRPCSRSDRCRRP